MSPNKTGPKRDRDLEGSVGFDFTENVFFFNDEIGQDPS